MNKSRYLFKSLTFGGYGQAVNPHTNLISLGKRYSSSYWILNAKKSDVDKDRVRVNFNPETNRVSGIITEKSLNFLKALDEVEEKEDLVLSHFSESFMFPGPQLEETVVAERGHLVDWETKKLESGKHGHLKDLENSKADEIIEFGATLDGTKISRHRNMPHRGS